MPIMNYMFNKEGWPFTPLRFIIDDDDVTFCIQSTEKQHSGGKVVSYFWNAPMEDQDQRAAGYAQAALQRLRQHAVFIAGQFQKMLRMLNKQKSD